jgi:hypothetical protein
MSMLVRGPEKEARLIQEKTGVPTVSAVDGMVILFSESLKVQTGMGQKDLTGFL